MYKVRAIYSCDPRPYSEVVGTYSNLMDAEDARASFEDQKNFANFMFCDIVFCGEILE